MQLRHICVYIYAELKSAATAHASGESRVAALCIICIIFKHVILYNTHYYIGTYIVVGLWAVGEITIYIYTTSTCLRCAQTKCDGLLQSAYKTNKTHTHTHLNITQ